MSMEFHPSFEELSAYHDGEAAEWAAHVDGCRACRALLDELSALSTAVAHPPADASTVAGDDPVTRALASLDEGTAAIPLGQPAAAPSSGPERLPATPGPRRPLPPPAQARPERSRWLGWATAASAAAVILVVAGVLAVLGRDGGDRPTTSALTDAGGPPSGAPAGERGVGPGGGAAAGDQAMVGGDLGEIPDVVTLLSRTEPSLRAGAAAAREDSSQSAVPAPPGLPRPTPRVVGTRPCEAEARTRQSDLGQVVYYATARHGGRPAVVLGFAPVGGTGPITVQVLAEESCRLLLSASSP